MKLSTSPPRERVTSSSSERVTSDQIIDLMLNLNKQKGVTFLFSTHDPRVMTHARRVVRIADGKIVEGSLQEHQSAMHG